MKILICGSRGWRDPEPIEMTLQALREQYGEVIVVHGDAPKGADPLAARVAKQMGLEVIAEPADWSLGRHAGFLRNQRMLDTHPDIEGCYAFRSEGKSNGTDDMIKRAQAANIPTLVITD